MDTNVCATLFNLTGYIVCFLNEDIYVGLISLEAYQSVSKATSDIADVLQSLHRKPATNYCTALVNGIFNTPFTCKRNKSAHGE